MEKVGQLFLMMLVMILMFWLAVVSMKQHNLELDLQSERERTEKALEETESKCKRMTDSCIGILATGVWEASE